MDTRGWRRAFEEELRGNLMPFWRKRCLDHEGGGFIAEMANDGTLRRHAPKGLVLNARILWTFSRLHRELGETEDLELARRAYDYLQGYFLDHEHGGYVWRVGPNGDAFDRSKKIYGQAFTIYALSEFYGATENRQALDAAIAVYELVEANASEPRFGGYVEACAGNWTAEETQQLAAGDMVAPKSMNTHLHLLEAYTNLYRVWPDQGLEGKLRKLVGIFERSIIDWGAVRVAFHLHHFFDSSWQVLSDTYTYGHDIEAGWLLCEAAEVLEDERLEGRVARWSVELARGAATEALGDDGGLAYEGRGGRIIVSGRDWWCQAEAVVGFWHASQVDNDAELALAAERVWQFIKKYVVDPEGGEWFWRVLEDGSPDNNEPKVAEWKGPYHAVRMCLEMMRRLKG